MYAHVVGKDKNIHQAKRKTHNLDFSIKFSRNCKIENCLRILTVKHSYLVRVLFSQYWLSRRKYRNKKFKQRSRERKRRPINLQTFLPNTHFFL